MTPDGSRLGVVADYYHKCLYEALLFDYPQNCHTKHCTRHYAKPLLCAALISVIVLLLN